MTTTTDAVKTISPRALTRARRRHAAARFWREYRSHRAASPALPCSR